MGFVKSVLALISSDYISKFVSFIIWPLIAVSLGPEKFGEYNVLNIIISYFSIFVIFGFDKYYFKVVKADFEKCLFKQIIKIQLINSIGCCVLLILISNFLLTESKNALLLFSIYLVINVFNLEWYLQYKNKFKIIMISRIIKSLSFLILTLIVYYIGVLSINLIILSFLFGNLFGNIIMVLNIKESLYLKDIITTKISPIHLKNSCMIFLSALIIQIYINSDSLFLSYIKGNIEVGYYNASYKLIFVLSSLSVSLFMVFMPLISKKFKTDKNEFKSLIERYSKYIGMISFPILFGGMYYSEPIITFLYTNEYSEAARSFSYLLGALFIIMIASPYAYTLVICDLEKKFLLSVSIGAGVNLILNYLLIPNYSHVGAAIATMTAELIVFLIQYYIFSKYLFKHNLIKTYYKIFISSVIMLGFIYKIQNFILGIFVGALVYLLTLLAVKELRLMDLKKIKINEQG